MPDTEAFPFEEWGRAAEAGVTVAPLSQHYAREAPHPGLILGFASAAEAAQDQAAGRLAAVLRGHRDGI